MDAETGLLRIARVVEILGMIWGVLGILVSVWGLVYGHDAGDKWFVAVSGALIGAIGYGLARAIAWIIKGFAQKKA